MEKNIIRIISEDEFLGRYKKARIVDTEIMPSEPGVLTVLDNAKRCLNTENFLKLEQFIKRNLFLKFMKKRKEKLYWVKGPFECRFNSIDTIMNLINFLGPAFYVSAANYESRKYIGSSELWADVVNDITNTAYRLFQGSKIEIYIEDYGDYFNREKPDNKLEQKIRFLN